MGLDVYAYATAALTDPHPEVDACWERDGHAAAYIIDPSFHRSLRGLIADRHYEVGGETKHVHNSYGGHNRFRVTLAQAFLGVEPEVIWHAPEDWSDRPFFELIHFADNEGTIGPEAAADLLADFEAGAEGWAALELGEYDRSKYDEWITVLRCAANGGLAEFR